MRRQTLVVLSAAAMSAMLVFAAVAVASTIKGTQGDDLSLDGTTADDKIVAKKGNDVVKALAGNDVVNAGRGNDTVHGDDGNDTLKGKKGTDTLFGDLGDDVINSKGDGKKGGIDAVFCGDGNDVVSADKNDVVNDVVADCETVKQPGKGKGPKP